MPSFTETGTQTNMNSQKLTKLLGTERKNEQLKLQLQKAKRVVAAVNKQRSVQRDQELKQSESIGLLSQSNTNQTVALKVKHSGRGDPQASSRSRGNYTPVGTEHKIDTFAHNRLSLPSSLMAHEQIVDATSDSEAFDLLSDDLKEDIDVELMDLENCDEVIGIDDE